MKTRMQRLVELPDRMEYNITRNWFDFASLISERTTLNASIVEAVKAEIDMHLAVYGECDPVEQTNYMAGPNYDQAGVMYCVTGDPDWLPAERCDPHITF